MTHLQGSEPLSMTPALFATTTSPPRYGAQVAGSGTEFGVVLVGIGSEWCGVG